MGIGRKTTSPLYEGLAKLLHDAPAKLRKFLDLESYLGPKDIDGVPVRAAKIRLLKANITYSKSEATLSTALAHIETHMDQKVVKPLRESIVEGTKPNSDEMCNYFNATTLSMTQSEEAAQKIIEGAMAELEWTEEWQDVIRLASEIGDLKRAAERLGWYDINEDLNRLEWNDIFKDSDRITQVKAYFNDWITNAAISTPEEN